MISVIVGMKVKIVQTLRITVAILILGHREIRVSGTVVIYPTNLNFPNYA